MCTLFANLYVLLTWAPHMVCMGTPYIFHIYVIRRGWLGNIVIRTSTLIERDKEIIFFAVYNLL